MKEASENDRNSLLFLDNLEAQTRDEFKSALYESALTFTHFFVANCTSEQQSIDHGIGALVKKFMRDFAEEWLEEYTNGVMNIDSLSLPASEGGVTASERRILCTLWLHKAWTKLTEIMDFFELAVKLGGNLAIDGSNDDKIKLQGIDFVIFLLLLMLMVHGKGILQRRRQRVRPGMSKL